MPKQHKYASEPVITTKYRISVRMRMMVMVLASFRAFFLVVCPEKGALIQIPIFYQTT